MSNTNDYYSNLIPCLKGLLDQEHDMIANLANASALLFQTLPDLNWAGFYLYKNDELILGPFQGKVACMHIALGKGVCGTSALYKECLRVDNVHEFPGHIACDGASNSEIVIPLLKENTLIGVLDIDSPSFQRFTQQDEDVLRQFCEVLVSSFTC